MADVFDSKKRSEIMAKIRSVHTFPELVIRKFLFANGFRFRLHNFKLPGRPDITLRKYNTAIFVNGCFWHAHTNCKNFKFPTTRQEYWRPKLLNNKAKDTKNIKKIKKLGWDVIVIWECELERNRIEQTLNKLLARLEKN